MRSPFQAGSRPQFEPVRTSPSTAKRASSSQRRGARSQRRPTSVTVSIVAIASQSGVESGTRRTPTRPASRATCGDRLKIWLGRSERASPCSHVDQDGVGEARIVERPDACGALVGDIEGGSLDRLAVGQPFEALQDHDDRDDKGAGCSAGRCHRTDRQDRARSIPGGAGHRSSPQGGVAR